MLPRVVALNAVTALACGGPTAPPNAGTIIVRAEQGPALSGTVGLDSVHVVLQGPTDTTVSAAPGDTVAIRGLKAGTYTVTLVGFKQGSVLYFGLTKNVQVSSAVDTTRVPFAPPRLNANAGNNETTAVGRSVPIAPSVIAEDSSGNSVAGVNVTFAVIAGGGSIGGANPTSTNGSGIATVSSWTLGPSAGLNTLTATANGLPGSPVTFTATDTGVPPPPATWPNDPVSNGVAGWSVLTDDPTGVAGFTQTGWATYAPEGNPSSGYGNGAGSTLTASDSTGPDGPNPWQYYYKQGDTLVCGAGPTDEAGPTNQFARTYKNLYIGYLIKFSTNFSFPPDPEVHTLSPFDDGNGGFILNIGFAKFVVDNEFRGQSGGTTVITTSSNGVVPNTWNRVEILWTSPTFGGNLDGTVQIWLNGNLIANQTNVYTGESTATGWSFVKFTEVWGGCTGTPTPSPANDSYIWINHIRMSVK